MIPPLFATGGDARERLRQALVAPDAYFVLRQGDQVRRFFLEANRSTEEDRRLVDKFVGYWWYLQDSRFVDARGGRARVNVLFVTTGERRLQNLVETLRRMPKPNRAMHGGKGVFRLLSEGEYSIVSPSLLLALLGITPVG